MDEFRVRSTSGSTADADPIILRETERVRLLFRPTLVANEANPAASVRGEFIYQRKSSRGEWMDHRELDLNQLRASEWIRLELHSAELLKLITELSRYYDLVAEHGIPRGSTEFVRVSSVLKRLLEDPSRRDVLFSREGSDFVSAFASWASASASTSSQAFSALTAAQTASLDAAFSVGRLQTFVTEARANIQNSREEDWQQLLTGHSWALSRVFSAPFVLLSGKPYVGGKSIENLGGKVSDFLVQNRLTKNVAIIEIKTPSAQLLGAKYREDIFGAGDELSGGVVQLLDQRTRLVEEFRLLALEDMPRQPLNPRAVLLIGDATDQLTSEARIRCFELYRNDHRQVDIVTFDELIEQVEILIQLLSQP